MIVLEKQLQEDKLENYLFEEQIFLLVTGMIKIKPGTYFTFKVKSLTFLLLTNVLVTIPAVENIFKVKLLMKMAGITLGILP